MFWLAEVFNGRYTQEELDRHEKWARQQRAETVGHLFSATGRGLVKAVVAVGRSVKRAAAGVAAAYRSHRHWRQKRAAIRELSGLSDYLLRDIGLHRGDIRPVVEGLLDRNPEVRTEVRAFSSRHQEPASDTAAGSQESVNEWRRAA